MDKRAVREAAMARAHADTVSHRMRSQWTGYQRPVTPGSEAKEAASSSKILTQRAASVSRTFAQGESYTPGNLNEGNAMGYRMKKKKVYARDVFELTGLDPLVEYKNTIIFAPFLTEIGRIRNHRETNLTSKNQRRLTKAVKRARAMGLLNAMQRPRLPAFSSLRIAYNIED